MAVLTRPGETLLTRMPYCAHSIANVCVILRTPPSVAPYGAEGTQLFGRYEVMESVKTMAPRIPSLIKTLAAALAV